MNNSIFKVKHIINQSLTTLALITMVASPFGFPLGQTIAYAAEDDVTVTITKYIDGTQATGVTANNAGFLMNASWLATNVSGGIADSGTYVLGQNNNPVPYQAMTTAFATGANYSTSEDLAGNAVGASCTEGKPFALVGYTTGDTMEAAAAATPSATAPALTGITSNKFVIVWNHDCLSAEGDINGEVTGGGAPEGTLAVTSVDALDTTATADGSFGNGWRYAFNVTVPDTETGVAMKFADWTNMSASSTLAAANNMRISSLQANNSNATILVTAANTYTVPNLTITGDLNPNLPGKQIQIIVEVAVPSSTVNGSYSTSYGIRTQ